MRKIVLIVALLCFARAASAQVQQNGAISATSAACATASSCVTLNLPAGQLSGVAIQITQTYSATLQFEGTVEGVTWVAVAGVPVAGGAPVTSVTTTGLWQLSVSGLAAIRVRASAYASGQAGVSIQSAVQPSSASSGGTISGNVTVVQPTGTNLHAVLDSSSKTQVVDGAGNVLPTTASGPVTPANADAIVMSYETLGSGVITTAMTGTTSTVVIAGTASNYIYISRCTTSNGSLTVSTDILLQDGLNGTTIDIIPTPAATVATTGGSGAVVNYGDHPLKVPTSGNGLFAVNVTTGSSTKISCNGFKSTVSY